MKLVLVGAFAVVPAIVLAAATPDHTSNAAEEHVLSAGTSVPLNLGQSPAGNTLTAQITNDEPYLTQHGVPIVAWSPCDERCHGSQVEIIQVYGLSARTLHLLDSRYGAQNLDVIDLASTPPVSPVAPA